MHMMTTQMLYGTFGNSDLKHPGGHRDILSRRRLVQAPVGNNPAFTLETPQSYSP
jgi:hypothetical protein